VNRKTNLNDLAAGIVRCAGAPGRFDIHGRILMTVLASFPSAVFTESPASVFCFAAISIIVMVWLHKSES
jgi:hypothetical protein